MKTKLRICALALALCCCLTALLCLPASASGTDESERPASAPLETSAQTRFGCIYRLSPADFGGDETLRGVFLTEVPAAHIGTLRCGARVLRAGDILAAEMLESLCFVPVCSEECDAVLRYQPVRGGLLGAESRFTLRIGSGKNRPPKAEPAELETYKNVVNDGVLTGSDPENGALTFQLADAPKRGAVEIKPDGNFVYTPEHNKVGEDEFTFTVTDDAGNVSEPATVRVRILKPTERRTFADLEGSYDAFEALWLREAGLYSGTTVAKKLCFLPSEKLSRGEFLVMLMELCDLPVEPTLSAAAFTDAQDAPAWVQPYLAGALRCGLVRGETGAGVLCFRPNDAITAQEAAVLAQGALHLPVSAAARPEDQPLWAAASVQALYEAGVRFAATDAPMTRLDAAKLLYQLSRLTEK